MIEYVEKSVDLMAYDQFYIYSLHKNSRSNISIDGGDDTNIMCRKGK